MLFKRYGGDILRRVGLFFKGQRVSCLLIAAGLLLRFKHYFEIRSLRLDEAALVVELIRRPFNDIFFGVGYNPDAPTAPTGFLMVVKGLIEWLGNSELVLRLFPFAVSIFSIFLFYKLIKNYLAPKVQPVALGLFVFSEPLIFYSCDVKSYSCDVLATIILLLLYEYIMHNKFTVLKGVFVGIVGFIVVWFSFSSVFVLVALGLVGLSFSFHRKNKGRMFYILTAGTLWIMNIVGLYFNGLSQIRANHSLNSMWKNAFMPKPMVSVESFVWLKESFLSIFLSTLSISMTIVAFLLFIIGCVVFYRRDQERFALIILPIFITLFFAILSMYPFYERFVLFLVPPLIIFISEGLHFIGNKLHVRFRWVMFIMLLVLFYHPVKTNAYYMFHSYDKEQVRYVMEYLKNNFEEGDAVYLNNNATDAFIYYQNRLNFPRRIKSLGRILDAAFVEEQLFAAMRFEQHVYDEKGVFLGIIKDKSLENYYKISPDQFHRINDRKRVWLLFSHVKSGLKALVLTSFDNQGKRLKKYEREGASVYLYDLETFNNE